MSAPTQEQHEDLMRRMQECLDQMRASRVPDRIASCKVLIEERLKHLGELNAYLQRFEYTKAEVAIRLIRRQLFVTYRELGTILGVTDSEEHEVPPVTLESWIAERATGKP